MNNNFVQRASRGRDYKLSLAANVPLQFSAADASSLTLISASAGSPVKITFDNGSSSISARVGDGLDDNALGEVSFESAAAQDIVVRVSTGFQRTSTGVNVNATATVESANVNKGVADVTIAPNVKALIIGANANRKSVLIRSDDANTGAVRIADNATVAAATGYKLLPDDSIALSSEGAIYAFNPSLTAPVVLSIIELERV